MRSHLSLVTAVAAVLTALAVPVGAVPGAAGQGTGPYPVNTAPGVPKWVPGPGPRPDERRANGDRLAYVALAGDYRVRTVDVATREIVGTDIVTDAAQGVAVTPDGAKVYVANTGRYEVLVADAAGGTPRAVHVGPHPQDVMGSPDGRKVYATVTGGATGAGGSDLVAVIDTATDQLVRNIHVGTAPRQVVFTRDGARAYVTDDDGVAVIDVAADRVVRSIHVETPPQGIAVDPAGHTLYVTEPRADVVSVIDAATGRVRGRIRAGHQPWAVAVTPDGATAYVTEMNDGAIAVVDAANRTITGTIEVGKLPEAVAVTPDGEEAWVGNGLSGSVSVIDTDTDEVVATIAGGTGTKPIDAAPLGIAFGPAPSTPSQRPSPPVATRPSSTAPRKTVAEQTRRSEG